MTPTNRLRKSSVHDESRPAGACQSRVALVAALAVGYVKYREHAHEQVAKHYVQRSRPEYRRIRDRMARVYLSFRPQHLGGIDRTGLRRAKTLAAFRREVRLAAREGLNGLDYPRAQIKATRRVLATADTSALKRVDTPPLAGDSRQARESHALAREHGVYIRAIRGFLPRYAALIRYIDSVIRLSARYSVTLTAGVESVQGIGSPAEFNRTVRRLARRLAPISTKLRRLDPPPALQETHRANVTYATGVVNDLKALLRAFEARDLPRIKAIGKPNRQTREDRAAQYPEQLPAACHPLRVQPQGPRAPAAGGTDRAALSQAGRRAPAAVAAAEEAGVLLGSARGCGAPSPRGGH